MCWRSYNTPIKKTTTEDITCYKVFESDSIVWKKRKFWFNSQKIIERLVSICIAYPYIPYKENPKIDLICVGGSDWFCDIIYNWYINEGYHSYETLDRVQEYITDKSFIIKCIIPKGSEYYINEYEEIVSSNIIVTDKTVK